MPIFAAPFVDGAAFALYTIHILVYDLYKLDIKRRKAVDAILKASLPKLREKLLEALQAVLPIAAIVLVLCFTIAPVSPSILLCFLLGAAMIVVGIMFFTLGAEMSMTPMGERVGAVITKSRKLPVILGIGFLLGFLITISEPDLQVLANQVPSIPNRTLILSVAAGVGLFLVFAFLRMLIGISLPKLLVLFYGMIFLLAAFVPKEFLAVAFDSGGVTTGPMTVPFIMALGVGVSAIRGDRHAADDSFGLVAMCSIGPILAVLILGIVFRASDSTYIPPVLPEVSDSVELWQLFHVSLPTYLEEIAVSLLPIIVMFGIFNLWLCTWTACRWAALRWVLRIPTWALCCSSPAQMWALCPPVIIWVRCWPGRASAGSSFPLECSSVTSSSRPSRLSMC